mgnify:FL=1
MKNYKYIILLSLVLNFMFGYNVYFTVDSRNLEFPTSDYENIVINGSWNNWSGWGVTLNDSDGDGIYIGTIDLSPGIYEYVIALTGPADDWSGWGESISAPLNSSCDYNPNDEWANYGFEINDSDVEQSYCAGTCDSLCEDSGNDEPDDNYILVWSDEFEASDIDESKWNFQIGTGNWGWGNGEHQYYTNRLENAFIEDGKLVIQALNESYQGSNYTSARMTTKNKGDWLYGKIKARIKVPSAGGTWPAFWMMPTNSVYGGWPNSGEIDIMEHYGCNDGEVTATVHNNLYNWNGGIPPTSYYDDTSATSEFHDYEVIWTDSELKFFVDGSWIGSYYNQNSGWEQWPYNQDFYIILNLAVGSHFMPCSTEDDLFPQRYEIDYVRVYQLSNCSLLGDYNQDNSLDILDVVSVVEVIVSQTDDYNECIDINEDGDVNVIDIVMLVDEIIR